MFIKVVLKKCKFFFILDDVIEFVLVYMKDYAMEILCMIKDVFYDIDISYGCMVMLLKLNFYLILSMVVIMILKSYFLMVVLQKYYCQKCQVFFVFEVSQCLRFFFFIVFINECSCLNLVNLRDFIINLKEIYV